METPDGHPPVLRILSTLAVLSFFLAELALSQGTCLDLSSAGGTSISSAPGRVLTLGIRIENRSAQARRVQGRVRLPALWRSITADTPLELAGGASDVHLLSIAIPGSAPAGIDTVSFTAFDMGAPDCTSAIEILVSVQTHRKLELQLVEAPRFVLGGSTYRALFVLQNLGNAAAHVRLSASSGDNATLAIDSPQVILPPQDARTIVVTSGTDERVSRNQKQVVELHASLDEDSTQGAVSSSTVDVVPRVGAGEDQFHEIPVLVTLRAAGEQSLAGGQIEVSGGGTLSDATTDRFDFLVRTPDIQSRSVLGLHDEYRFTYLSKAYEVRLGDRAYDLSPLTELARYAFGVGAQARLGDVTAGGFANRTRFFSPAESEQAAFVSYGLAEQSSVGINYLHKDDGHQSSVGTVRALVRPIGENDIDLEYGRSTLDGLGDGAFAARAHGTEQWLSYDARYVHASPNYGGYYRDVDFKTASLEARPVGALRIEAYARDEKRNLFQDTSQQVAPRDKYYQLGFGYGELIGLFYREDDESDELPVPKYNRREHSLQLRSGYALPFGDVFAIIDLGSSRELVFANEGPYRRFQLSTNVSPEAHQRYGFSVEYLTQEDLYGGGQIRSWSGNLSAAFALAPHAQFIASLYGTRTVSPMLQTYSLADLTFAYELPFKHTLTLRGRQSLFAPAPDGKDVAWLAEYSIPLSVPVSRLSSSGAIRGKVIDGVSRAPLKDVVISAGGATAVSDDEGEFFFPALRPDVYGLDCDLGSKYMDRVVEEQMPMSVTVRPGEESHPLITVLRSASVSGKVTVYDFPETSVEDTTLLERATPPVLVVELSGSSGTLRRLSDAHGRFAFDNLRPGQYTVRLLSGEIPAYHFVEQDSFAVKVAQGDKYLAQFRVLPRKRKIQILQEQTVPPEPKKPPVPPAPIKRKQLGVLIRPSKTGSGYVIQTSSWRTMRKADLVSRELASRTGLAATVGGSRQTWFCVWLGQFASIREARSACKRFGIM
ncbi:MAG TPA: carboxypeptidase-like regulatory domain-containing protein [Bacteroidota bacterium]|nr:carboxypeptidase-like regulatory domain-containing protein [Bacteroidota bacterium]